MLVAFTLDIHGFSLYRLVWQLPGINSMRAITRIMLVIMWPLAVFAAWAMDRFIRRFTDRHRWLQGFAYLVAVLMVSESALFSHGTYVKADEQARLEAIASRSRRRFPPIRSCIWNLCGQHMIASWDDRYGVNKISANGFDNQVICKQQVMMRDDS